MEISKRWATEEWQESFYLSDLEAPEDDDNDDEPVGRFDGTFGLSPLKDNFPRITLEYGLEEDMRAGNVFMENKNK